jgi:hypothetical protein
MFIVELVSCGIEDYPFLPSVPSGNISVSLNQEAKIKLPVIDLNVSYFTHFTIYYHIYVSGTYYPEIDPSNMSDLNPALLADYNAFLPYTNTDTATGSNASIGKLFSDRQYYSLTLEGTGINDALSSSAFGKTITLNFMESIPRLPPRFIIDNRHYTLQRSPGNGLFHPVPGNRYFFNTEELHKQENISIGNTVSTINADVTHKDTLTDRYTYTALYIVATGIDSNFSPLYSTPAFIGVFYLPAP